MSSAERPHSAGCGDAVCRCFGSKARRMDWQQVSVVGRAASMNGWMQVQDYNWKEHLSFDISS